MLDNQRYYQAGMEKLKDKEAVEIPETSSERLESSGLGLDRSGLALLRRTFLAAIMACATVTVSDRVCAQPAEIQGQRDYELNVVRFIKFFKDKNIEINFYESPAEFAAHRIKVDAVKDANLLSRALSILYRNLTDNYPDWMTGKYGLKKIHLVDNVRMEGEKIGGTISKDGLILSLSSDVFDIANVFNHEFLHFLHEKHEKGNVQGDHQAWTKTNPNGAKDYTFRDGLAAIKAEKSDKNKWRSDTRNFAGDYGQNGGIEEDEASTAEALMDENRIKDLLSRARKSETLRKKIIMVTGCEINEKGQFINIDLDQYKAATGLPGWRYYALWSIGQNGLREMDQQYWNSVIIKAEERGLPLELRRQDAREDEMERIKSRAFSPLILDHVKLVDGKVAVPTIPIR